MLFGNMLIEAKYAVRWDLPRAEADKGVILRFYKGLADNTGRQNTVSSLYYHQLQETWKSVKYLTIKILSDRCD